MLSWIAPLHRPRPPLAQPPLGGSKAREGEDLTLVVAGFLRDPNAVEIALSRLRPLSLDHEEPPERAQRSPPCAPQLAAADFVRRSRCWRKRRGRRRGWCQRRDRRCGRHRRRFSSGRTSERLREPAPCIAEVGVAVPEPLEGRAEAEGLPITSAPKVPFKRLLEVAVLPLEPIEPLHLVGTVEGVGPLFGKREIVGRVPLLERLCRRILPQLFESVCTDSFEHPEAALPPSLRHPQKAVVDERGDAVENIELRLTVRTRADRLGRFEGSAADEDREADEEPSLGLPPDKRVWLAREVVRVGVQSPEGGGRPEALGMQHLVDGSRGAEIRQAMMAKGTQRDSTGKGLFDPIGRSRRKQDLSLRRRGKEGIDVVYRRTAVAQPPTGSPPASSLRASVVFDPPEAASCPFSRRGAPRGARLRSRTEATSERVSSSGSAYSSAFRILRQSSY